MTGVINRRRARKRAAVVTRRRAPARVVTKTRTRYVRVRRAGRRAIGAVSARKEKFGVGVAAAVYGYAKAKNPAMLDKIPSVAGAGKELTIGIAASLLLKPKRGSWFDHATTALIAIGAYNFGSAQATGIALQGDDDDSMGEL